MLHSRIAKLLRPVLEVGEQLWALFVLYANNHYKERFLAAFDHDVLSPAWAAAMGRRASRALRSACAP